jgi:hypothetical protein
VLAGSAQAQAAWLCLVRCVVTALSDGGRGLCRRGFERGVDSGDGERLEMYKLKDWPTEDDFHNKLPRHFADFVQLIPFQARSKPTQTAQPHTRVSGGPWPR